MSNPTNKINNSIKNGYVIWLTGLSGSGKSTLAKLLQNHFQKSGIKTCLLDGDIIRNGLNKDLGFSNKDRTENIRRLSEVSKIMADTGLVVIAAFISPFKNDREGLKKTIGVYRFFEIHVDCPIDVCEKRDVKGLYKDARDGKIKDFTGVDSPYESPENPGIVVKTNLETENESLSKIINALRIGL